MSLLRSKYVFCKGLTLIELVTVMAVIGIVSAIALPNFFAWREHAKLAGACRALMSDLSMARIKAVNTGFDAVVVLSGSSYEVLVDRDGSETPDSGVELLKSKSYPEGIFMKETTFSGSNAVFNPNGTASPGSVLLERSLGGEKKPGMRVVVNWTGRIRVEKG